jgi:hypothetical protein
VKGADEKNEKKAKDVKSKPSMVAASPTFKDVHVPAFAMPKTKLASDNEAIAPVLGLLKAEGTATKPEEKESRFATPPPPDKKKRHWKRAKRRARKARRARRYRNWKKNRPRYRCWWTNTRPRIWRCGY